MSYRWIGALFGAAWLSTAPLMLPAQTPPKPAAAKATPDLSGNWDHPKEHNPRIKLMMSREDPSMLPEAARRYEEIRKDRDTITAPLPDQGDEKLDFAAYPYCMPYGFPRVYATTDSFEIVNGRGRIYIFFESGVIQRIYTDGRKHPKGPPLTFMGQSIGRWEGDTLVVETKDLNEMTWLDGIGRIHSDTLRVVQRIRRVKQDTLEIDFLFDDPKTFTKPWTAKKVYHRRPADETAMNYFLCEEFKTADFLKVMEKGTGETKEK